MTQEKDLSMDKRYIKTGPDAISLFVPNKGKLLAINQ